MTGLAYRSFEIRIATGFDKSRYYEIWRCEDKVTIMKLCSEKACKNVIDTFLKKNKRFELACTYTTQI